jgi:3-oxoacyl-[acyl-carrier protein] reductase
MSRAPQEQVAVVTGGSMGIGLAIAARLCADGYRTVIVGRNRDRLEAAAERLGAGALPLCGDVSVRDNVESIAAAVRGRFGHVDVLVNNAGLLETIPSGTPLEQAEEIFDRVVGASLKGAFLMAQALVPMITAPGGRIINIGSIVAQSGGSVPGYTAYAPAKAGQHGLTLALARELGPKGITVNTVAPGFIGETGMTAEFDAERVGQIAAQIPLQRAGRAEDIANAVAWLASAQADYVTGTTLPVNGGWRFN